MARTILLLTAMLAAGLGLGYWRDHRETEGQNTSAETPTGKRISRDELDAMLQMHSDQLVPETSELATTNSSDTIEMDGVAPSNGSPPLERETDPLALSTKELKTQALALLDRRCGECHTGETRKSEAFDLQTRFFGQSIENGSADESRLMEVIENDEMPDPEQGLQPLPETEKRLIRQWINSLQSDRTRIGFHEEFERVAEDLAKVSESRTTKDFFYVSLRHFSNQKSVTDSQLDDFRLALAKTLNSLHWQPELIVPESIDPSQTLYRIDRREFRFDASAINRLLRENPYQAMAESEMQKSPRFDVARRIVRADWLISELTSPDIYHQLLYDNSEVAAVQRAFHGESESNLFDSLPGLLSTLQIDYDSLYDASGRIDRAYFDHADPNAEPKGSEVSDNYRVLDRLRSVFGPVWLSYDFGSNDGEQDIQQRPAGPWSASRDDSFTFHQDGGEVIFQLPNGLHGYLIVDASGQRLSVAPQRVVRDSVTRLPIANGADCFRCHWNGYRDGPTIQPSGLAQLPKRHLGFQVMDDEKLSELTKRDSVSYRNAVSQLVSSMRLEFAENDRPVDTLIRHYHRDLTITQILEELPTQENLTYELVEIFQKTAEELDAFEPGTAQGIQKSIAEMRSTGTIDRSTFELIFDRLLGNFDHRAP